MGVAQGLAQPTIGRRGPAAPWICRRARRRDEPQARSVRRFQAAPRPGAKAQKIPPGSRSAANRSSDPAPDVRGQAGALGRAAAPGSGPCRTLGRGGPERGPATSVGPSLMRGPRVAVSLRRDRGHLGRRRSSIRRRVARLPGWRRLPLDGATGGSGESGHSRKARGLRGARCSSLCPGRGCFGGRADGTAR